MPRIENSELGQPQEGNIQLVVVRPLNDSPALYLEIPLGHIASLSERPRKYLKYLGWCIMGVEGRIAMDSPHQVDDIGDEGAARRGYSSTIITVQLLSSGGVITQTSFDLEILPSLHLYLHLHLHLHIY